jgi:N-acetylglutamate synthase
VVTGDRLAQAFAELFIEFSSAWERGWARWDPSGILTVASGAPVVTLNGVWTTALDGDPGVASSYLDDLLEAGLPHCMQLRPGVDPRFLELTRARGMTAAGRVPVMALTDPGTLRLARNTDLRIQELAPAEFEVHAGLAAPSFDLTEETMTIVVPQALLEHPGVCAYVGEIDGVPVATSLGATLGEAVMVFNVVTDPGHRRRGYGAAVTARAVLDGFAAGAEWAMLQSSEMGFKVYEQLGFELVEAWDLWVS